MKNLLYLGIILMVASCGSNESENEKLKTDLEEMSKKNLELEAKLKAIEAETPQFKTIKIGNLEVMTEDLGGKMDWDEAMKACADLDEGWRLPTKDELNILYENKDKIGGFADEMVKSIFLLVSNVFDRVSNFFALIKKDLLIIMQSSLLKLFSFKILIIFFLF